MSDHSRTDSSSRAIPLRRAIVGGVALLIAGVTLGMVLGEMSGPSMASAPNASPRKEAELTNMATEPSNPLTTGQLADLMRGSQERGSTLQSVVPLNTADPLQRTGPINGLLASAAGAMPLMPGEIATPADRWTALNDRVANVLNNGAPTREVLEQLVGLVNDTPPAAPSPIVQAGGPGSPPIAPPTPLPPPVYEGINKASPN